MILPRLLLVIAGLGVALLGLFGPETYFNARHPRDIPAYRIIAVIVGIIFILVGLIAHLHRH